MAKVLQSRKQVDDARAELRRRGLDCLSGNNRLLNALRLLRLPVPPIVGYEIKSWDVLESVTFIEQHVPPDAAIIDFGAHTSEILPILHRLGYRNLTGIDLDPGVGRMPYAHAIRYMRADFTHTPFEDGSFDCITAISAIEHGFDSGSLLTECARLLRPGGHLIVSFDYWPKKIDTDGTLLYGLTWRIFSRDEALAFADDARKHGLVSDEPLQLDAADDVVRWSRWRYTFAWMVFRRV